MSAATAAAAAIAVAATPAMTPPPPPAIAFPSPNTNHSPMSVAASTRSPLCITELLFLHNGEGGGAYQGKATGGGEGGDGGEGDVYKEKSNAKEIKKKVKEEEKEEGEEEEELLAVVIHGVLSQGSAYCFGLAGANHTDNSKIRRINADTFADISASAPLAPDAYVGRMVRTFHSVICCCCCRCCKYAVYYLCAFLLTL
jgi:hypothetical protein